MPRDHCLPGDTSDLDQKPLTCLEPTSHQLQQPCPNVWASSSGLSADKVPQHSWVEGGISNPEVPGDPDSGEGS